MESMKKCAKSLGLKYSKMRYLYKNNRLIIPAEAIQKEGKRVLYNPKLISIIPKVYMKHQPKRGVQISRGDSVDALNEIIGDKEICKNLIDSIYSFKEYAERKNLSDTHIRNYMKIGLKVIQLDKLKFVIDCPFNDELIKK